VVFGARALAVSVDLWTKTVAEPESSLVLRSENPPSVCKGDECSPNLRPLLAMLNEIITDNPRAVGYYHLYSDVPEARGMGSSAAAAVSLAAAALELAKEEVSRDKIYKYSMISEKIIHGNPSGVDPAASTYGGAILYSKLEGIRRFSVNNGELAVCCSQSPRNTAAMLEVVARFKKHKPILFDFLTQSSSNITTEAATALESGNIALLAQLIKLSQEFLRIIGVSNEELEHYISSLESGGYAAKLTGAGGGGCVIGVPERLNLTLDCPAPIKMRIRYASNGVEAHTYE